MTLQFLIVYELEFTLILLEVSWHFYFEYCVFLWNLNCKIILSNFVYVVKGVTYPPRPETSPPIPETSPPVYEDVSACAETSSEIGGDVSAITGDIIVAGETSSRH